MPCPKIDAGRRPNRRKPGAGRGIATALIGARWQVYLTGRTITDTGDGGIAVPVDHRDDAQVAELFDRVADECGSLDLSGQQRRRNP